MRTFVTLSIGVLALAAAAWSLIAGMGEPFDVVILNDVPMPHYQVGGRMLVGFCFAIFFWTVAAFCFVRAWKHRRAWHHHSN